MRELNPTNIITKSIIPLDEEFNVTETYKVQKIGNDNEAVFYGRWSIIDKKLDVQSTQTGTAIITAVNQMQLISLTTEDNIYTKFKYVD